ncbi:hypothetical protein DIPPA_17525 [Diplonema papillatum]|nr:hypothetical protein DIPPA_17525 [Diplonema papillatum]
MSQRPALTRCYRQLLRACAQLNPATYGQMENTLMRHAMYRVRTEKAIELAIAAPTEGGSVSVESLEDAERKMEQLTSVLKRMAVLQPVDAPSLFSVCSAAHVDAGSPEYHRELEMKNRAMQVAVQEYADVLALLHDGGAYKHKIASRDNLSHFYFYEVPELVVVEVNPERNRTAIYIHSHVDIRENAHDEYVEMQEWNLEPEGVSFTQEYHVAALRVVQELIDNGALNKEYSVVVSGYSVGGAIASIVAVYLQEEHRFTVSNVITFGQPCITSDIGCAPLMDLPLLRIVTPLDGFKDTPTGTAKGKVFQKYGEELAILPAKLKEVATEAWIEENSVYVTMPEYHNLVHDTSAIVTYTPPPDHLRSHHGYGNIVIQDDDEIPKGELKRVLASRRRRNEGPSNDR